MLTSTKLRPINGKKLEQFRPTLPNYRQRELFKSGSVMWDVVKAQYVLQDRPRPFVEVTVAEIARFCGFDSEPISVEEGEGRFKGEGGIYVIDLAHSLNETIDLERPLIFVAMLISPEIAPQRILIDGLHRVYKALHQSRETLPSYLLSLDEERLCRH